MISNGSIRPQKATTVWERGFLERAFAIRGKVTRVPPCLRTSPGEKVMSATTRVLTICLLIFSAAALLYSQGGAYGTILGTVTDNSGAVLANATVDVTNTATNVTTHVQTSTAGDFTVPSLQPGVY